MFYIIKNESMEKDSKLAYAKCKAACRVVKDQVNMVKREDIPKNAVAIPFVYHYRTNRVSSIYATSPIISHHKDSRLCKEAYKDVHTSKESVKKIAKAHPSSGEIFEGFVIFKI